MSSTSSSGSDPQSHGTAGTTTDPTPAPAGIDLMDLTPFREGREMPNFDLLRREAPVYWNAPSERGPGFWALTRHEDVKTVATDTEGFCNVQGTQLLDRKVEGHGLASLHNLDDPEHAKLRRITIGHLRAVKVKTWQDVMTRAAKLLLDEAQDRGEFDLVDQVSSRLPMLVLAEVLGVPAEDAPKMVDWTNRLTSSNPDAAIDASQLAVARDEVLALFSRLTEERRREPGNDLISVLTHGEKDGRPLTWEELSAYYIMLVAGGNETVRHTISGATVALNETPGAWDRLTADHGLLPTAVEEMFRWVSPAAAMRRTATRDVEFGGTHIAAGDKVVLWFSAANRDPEVFDNPHEFQLDRSQNDHLSFGWGVHFCLGVHLARAEVRTYFTELLDRGIRMELAGQPRRLNHNQFRGWTDVPVRVVS